jgi:hypothetical protein
MPRLVEKASLFFQHFLHVAYGFPIALKRSSHVFQRLALAVLPNPPHPLGNPHLSGVSHDYTLALKQAF